MELRFAPGSHRGSAIEPKKNGGSHQGLQVHQTPDLVLPSLQLQVLGPSKNKGM